MVYKLDIPANEKRELIDQTYFNMIEVAKIANQTIKEVRKNAKKKEK